MSPEEPGSNPHEFQSFFSFSFAKNQSLQYLTLYLFLSAGCEKDHLCWNVVVKYISRMFWVTEKMFLQAKSRKDVEESGLQSI